MHKNNHWYKDIDKYHCGSVAVVDLNRNMRKLGPYKIHRHLKKDGINVQEIFLSLMLQNV